MATKEIKASDEKGVANQGDDQAPKTDVQKAVAAAKNTKDEALPTTVKAKPRTINPMSTTKNLEQEIKLKELDLPDSEGITNLFPPTVESKDRREQEAKAKRRESVTETLVQAKTKHKGGKMLYFDDNKWITDEWTTVRDSAWLRSQSNRIEIKD